MEDMKIIKYLYLKKVKNQNLDKYFDDITKMQTDIKGMVDDSFEEGFSEGEEWARSDEKLKVKGEIVGNLIQHTSMTDEEIFNIVDLGEEKWSERIKYLRSKYEEGLKIGKERFKQYEEEREE